MNAADIKAIRPGTQDDASDEARRIATTLAAAAYRRHYCRGETP
jgi:hypothetical protein